MISKSFHFDGRVVLSLNVFIFFLEGVELPLKFVFAELVCDIIFLHAVEDMLIGFEAMEG